jgi:GGDEF domain-containing protein
LLKKFAGCLSKHSAAKGKAYRFGGDEFVMLYDAQEGESLITIIKHDMYDLFEATKVSISYGCIEINDQQYADTQILKVDELMYKKNYIESH